MDDRLIDGHISSAKKEVTETDRIKETTVTKMELAEILEFFRARHQAKDKTLHKEIHFGNLSLLNIGFHHLEDHTSI